MGRIQLESPRANRGKGAGEAEGLEKIRGCRGWTAGVGRKRFREASLHLCTLEEQKESGQREPPALPRCQLPSPGVQEGAAGPGLHRTSHLPLEGVWTALLGHFQMGFQ